jgi:Zn-dependent peptidase ImmA (M78 family)
MTKDDLENKLADLDLPKINLDLKEVIDIVAQGYKIESVPFYGNMDNTTELLGLHIDDGRELSILINTEQTRAEKNLTIIHEMYHSLARKYNATQDERIIEELALRKYKELYGNPEFDLSYETRQDGENKK